MHRRDVGSSDHQGNHIAQKRAGKKNLVRAEHQGPDKQTSSARLPLDKIPAFQTQFFHQCGDFTSVGRAILTQVNTRIAKLTRHPSTALEEAGTAPMTTAKPAVTGHVKAAPASSAVASIMVHVDWNAGSDERIRLAANLADRFGAVLMASPAGCRAASARPFPMPSLSSPRNARNGSARSSTAWVSAFARLRASLRCRPNGEGASTFRAK